MGILERQALHASELSLPHPDNGREISFDCELPDDFAGAISFLRKL